MAKQRMMSHSKGDLMSIIKRPGPFWQSILIEVIFIIIKKIIGGKEDDGTGTTKKK